MKAVHQADASAPKLPINVYNQLTKAICELELAIDAEGLTVPLQAEADHA